MPLNRNIDTMKLISKLSNAVTKAAGSPWAFCAALFIVIFGKALGFDVNMIATITPFLMMFVIQYSQNRDEKALQLKLDELIKSNEQARNEIIGIEKMEEKDIDKMEL